MSTTETAQHAAVSDAESATYPGRGEVREFFAEHAADLDRCTSDVRPGLRMLGKYGLLDLGAPRNSNGALPTMLALVEDVAAECLSSGFALWAQRMVLEYLASHADEPVVAAELPDLRAGTRIGVTAMAPALRHVAGLEPVPVVAERTAGGLRLNGPIRWASNLFADALVVAPVRFEEGGGAVVFFRIGDAGVTVNPAPRLLALGATESSSMQLTDVEVPEGAVLSWDLDGFVRECRPSFLLVQSAFCSGLARAARAEAGTRIAGVNQEFAHDFDRLAARHDSVRRRLFEFANEPAGPDASDLLRLRLDAAQTAGEATRLESAVRGGAGYLADSPTDRKSVV